MAWIEYNNHRKNNTIYVGRFLVWELLIIKFLILPDKLIPISDFSKGKTAQIFEDVKNNNTEYIVLKNNQPTALVISIDNYREMADKAAKMELLLDKIEEKRLLGIANERISDGHETTDFNDVITELGFTEEEIYNGIDDVEFE